MKRLKIAFLLLSAVLMTAFLLSCKEPAGKEDICVDIAALSSKMAAELEYSGRIAPLGPSALAGRYGDELARELRDAEVVSCTETEGRADEIFLAGCSDPLSAQRVFALMSDYFEEELNTLGKFNPEERDRAAKAILELRGRYVIFCVCSDPAAAEKLIDGAFSGKDPDDPG